MKIKLNPNRHRAGNINFLLGKPGGGKSLYATSIIIKEVRLTRRLIVTNLALRLPELAAYCESEGIEIGCHINERIVQLADPWLKGFFAFRRTKLPLKLYGRKGHEDFGDADLAHLPPEIEQALSRGDLVVGECDYKSSYGDGGVLYVLDEAHIAFNSRAWQQTGQAVVYYLSQHRKLSDDVLVITQSANLIDRQFRSVAQDFTTIRNFSKEKYGFFRAPSLFVRRTFLHPPTGAPTDRAIETKSFRLDIKGTAQVYDTAAGIGIHGAQADKGTRASGLPWWLFVFGGAALVFIFLQVAPMLFAMPFSAITRHLSPSTTTPATPNGAARAPAINPSQAQGGGGALLEAMYSLRINTNAVVTGYSLVGSKFLVCLSSGEIIGANMVTGVRGVPGAVSVDGVLYAIKNSDEKNMDKYNRPNAHNAGY